MWGKWRNESLGMTVRDDARIRITKTNDYSDKDKRMLGGNPGPRAGGGLEDVYQGLVWNLY